MAIYNASLFLVLFMSLFMILLLWGRMALRGAVPMLYLLAGISIWVLCQLLHIIVIDPQVKYFWYQAKFAGIVFIPASFVILAADISSQKKRIKAWHLNGIYSISLLTLAAILTDPWFHLFRKKVEYVIVEQFILIRTVDGPAFWIFTVYSYILIIISALLLGDKARRSNGTERMQALLLLFGCVFPWVWNIVFLLMLDAVFPLDFTPVFMLVTEVVFIITLFYYRMFNIVPFTKHAVFGIIEDLVIVVDREGIIQDMNPAAQEVFETGKDSEGQNFSDFLGFLNPIPQGSLAELRGEFQGLRLGRTRDYLVRRTPISGKRGTSIGNLLVFKDITELSDSRRVLEQATQELAIQNDKKMLFVKQVNRNIRTPMNRIMGFAELYGHKDLSESQNEAVGHLTKSGGHLIQLINNITDYSRIETGKMELMEESVHFFDLIRHVCRLFEYPAEQKGISVSYSISGDVPAVLLMDSLRLTQILSNIVGNAVKFTQRGHVSLSVRKLSGPWMEIDICDTGIGISDKDIGRLFMPYQQAEDGAFRKFGGTGLGLAIVKELVDRMDGDITITSILGSGTTIHLKLPCCESVVKSPVYNLDQVSDYKSKPLHVGLITQNLVQQKLIRRFFRTWPQVSCYDIQDPLAEPLSVIPWDILLVNLDDFSPAELKPLMTRSHADTQKKPGLLGLTNDVETMEREKLGRGTLEDCILMPVSHGTLNDSLRRLVLKQ